MTVALLGFSAVHMCFHELLGVYTDYLFLEDNLVDATPVIEDYPAKFRSLSLKLHLNRRKMSVFNNLH